MIILQMELIMLTSSPADRSCLSQARDSLRYTFYKPTWHTVLSFYPNIIYIISQTSTIIWWTHFTATEMGSVILTNSEWFPPLHPYTAVIYFLTYQTLTFSVFLFLVNTTFYYCDSAFCRSKFLAQWTFTYPLCTTGLNQDNFQLLSHAHDTNQEM